MKADSVLLLLPEDGQVRCQTWVAVPFKPNIKNFLRQNKISQKMTRMPNKTIIFPLFCAV